MKNLLSISDRTREHNKDLSSEIISRIREDIDRGVITSEDGLLRVDFSGKEEQWMSEEYFISRVLALRSFRDKYLLWSQYARYYICDSFLQCA